MYQHVPLNACPTNHPPYTSSRDLRDFHVPGGWRISMPHARGRKCMNPLSPKFATSRGQDTNDGDGPKDSGHTRCSRKTHMDPEHHGCVKEHRLSGCHSTRVQISFRECDWTRSNSQKGKWSKRPKMWPNGPQRDVCVHEVCPPGASSSSIGCLTHKSKTK